jgi:hypothetical protein
MTRFVCSVCGLTIRYEGSEDELGDEADAFEDSNESCGPCRREEDEVRFGRDEEDEAA